MLANSGFREKLVYKLPSNDNLSTNTDDTKRRNMTRIIIWFAPSLCPQCQSKQ